MVTKHLDVWWFFKLDLKTKFASLPKQQMVFHLPHGQNLILSPIFRSFSVMPIYYMKSTHFTHKIRYQETNFDHFKRVQHIVHTIAMHSCRTIFQPLFTFLAPSDSLDVISGFIHLVFHDSKHRYWTSLEACRLMLSYWSYQFRIICMSAPLLQLLIVVAKSSSFRGGSVHDDALDMFLYTVLLTGSSLLHLTNITYVHKHRKNCECCPGHYLSTSVY